MKILVVEDDKGVREMFGMVLEAMKLNVLLTATVKDAIAQMTKIKFDIILIDLLLGDELGTAVVDAAFKIYPKPPKIILMSAHPKIDNYISGYKMYTLLTKPFDFAVLSDVIFK